MKVDKNRPPDWLKHIDERVKREKLLLRDFDA
jgi:hypothetical protein